jgi:hypothetical protein
MCWPSWGMAATSLAKIIEIYCQFSFLFGKVENAHHVLYVILDAHSSSIISSIDHSLP